MTHHYTVERKFWKDRRGFLHMSEYWQIRCLVDGWRGTRITKPSSAQSKARMEEWLTHVATN